MKRLRFVILSLLLTVLSGCASGPYYYGGTSYRMHNIGGLPISGSLGVHVTSGSLMMSPNIVVSPTFVDWKK